MVNEREPPRRSPRLMTPGESSIERDNEGAESLDEESHGEEYSLPPEQNSNSDVTPSPTIHQTPPPPPTFTYPIMTEYTAPTTVSSSLSDVSKIKKLKGPDDWVEWNRNLESLLAPQLSANWNVMGVRDEGMII